MLGYGRGSGGEFIENGEVVYFCGNFANSEKFICICRKKAVTLQPKM